MKRVGPSGPLGDDAPGGQRRARRRAFAAEVGAAALIAALTASGAAWAEEDGPPPDDAAAGGLDGLSAKELLERGKQAMAAQDFVAAERALSRAAELERSYSILGNLGQVEAVLAASEDDEAAARRWWVRAATHLSEAIRAFPSAGPVEQRAALERKLADARGHVVTIGLEVSPATACATRGERELGCGPFPSPLYVEPGDITIVLRADGYAKKQVRVLNARPGSQHTLSESLSREGGGAGAGDAPPPGPVAEEAGGEGPLVYVGATLGGLGLVAGIAGGILYQMAGDRDEEAAALLAEGQAATGQTAFCREPTAAMTARCNDIRGRLEDHDAMQRAAVGLFVAGGVLIAGAVTLFVVDQMDDDEEIANLDVRPIVGPTGAGFTVGGRF